MTNFIQKILSSEKWIVIIMVLVLYVAAIWLVLVGSFDLVKNCMLNYMEAMGSQDVNTNLISTDFLHLIDVYLLALVFYIFAMGIFKLFIGNHVGMHWLKIKTMDDMKSTIATMIVLLLVTLFTEKVAIWKDAMDLFYTGIGIASICAMLIWYCILLKVKKEPAEISNKMDSPVTEPISPTAESQL